MHASPGCFMGATQACPWGGAGTVGRVCFIVPCSSPLRGQREVAKRQPAGTGRRSPARPVALFAGGSLISEERSAPKERAQREPARGMALQRGNGALYPRHIPLRLDVSARWPSASPWGRAGARPRGLWPCSRAVALSSEERSAPKERAQREPARGVALGRLNGALYPRHIPPRSDVSEGCLSASPSGRAGARSRASLVRERVQGVRRF